MEFTNAEISTILEFSFVKDKSARESYCEINSVLGNGTLSTWTAEEWFRRSETGENNTMNTPDGKRPMTTNTEQIMKQITLDRCVASRNITREMGVSQQNILSYLQKDEYKWSLIFVVPHDLTQKAFWAELILTLYCWKELMWLIFEVDSN